MVPPWGLPTPRTPKTKLDKTKFGRNEHVIVFDLGHCWHAFLEYIYSGSSIASGRLGP